jgi:hypothetical protein
MERRGMTLTASAPASGPYALTALVDDNFLGRPVCGSTVYFPLAIRSYQEAYGNVYARAEDVYSEKFAKTVPTMLPSEISHVTLMNEGKLPKTTLFNDTPVLSDPGLSEFVRDTMRSCSPAQQPERFAAVYRSSFGDGHLLTDSFRAAYLADIEANPDGAYQTYTTGAPPKRSENGFRQAAIKNDLRNFTPVAPMLLCGGQGDAATPFRLGAELMVRYWEDPTRAPKPGVVSMLDFEAPAKDADPFGELKRIFLAERDSYLASQPWPSWVDAYHQFLLPRYCYLAARKFFDTMR